MDATPWIIGNVLTVLVAGYLFYRDSKEITRGKRINRYWQQEAHRNLAIALIASELESMDAARDFVKRNFPDGTDYETNRKDTMEIVQTSGLAKAPISIEKTERPQ